MEEELETRQQWEFSGKEDDLRSLRTVLSEPRKKSSSFQASFVLGGLIGLLGIGAFFFADSVLPTPEELLANVPKEKLVAPNGAPREKPGGEPVAVAEATPGPVVETPVVETPVAVKAAPVVEPGSAVETASAVESAPMEMAAVSVREAPGLLPDAPGEEWMAPAAVASGTVGPALSGPAASRGPDSPAAALSASGKEFNYKEIAEVAAPVDAPSAMAAVAPRATAQAGRAAAAPDSLRVASTALTGATAGAAPSAPLAPHASSSPALAAQTATPSVAAGASAAHTPYVASRAAPTGGGVGAVAMLGAAPAEPVLGVTVERRDFAVESAPSAAVAPNLPAIAGRGAAPAQGHPANVGMAQGLAAQPGSPDLTIAALEAAPQIMLRGEEGPQPGAAPAQLTSGPAYMERLSQPAGAGGDRIAPAALAGASTAPATAPDGAADALFALDGVARGESGEIGAALVARTAESAPAAAAPFGSQTPEALAAVAEPLQIASLERPKEEGQIALGEVFAGVTVADAPDAPTNSLPAPEAPTLSAMGLEAPVNKDRTPIIASISLGSPRAFDLEPEGTASFAALIDRELPYNPPSTPVVTIDPAAAFSEPLDALQVAPRADAPLVTDADRLFTPGGAASAAPPGEVKLSYRKDEGRDAARKAVRAAARAAGQRPVQVVDTRPIWVRNGVAPPPNPKGLPVLAIVIDEVGAYGARVEDITSLPPAVTVSVIPSTEKAPEIVRQLRFSRREVLVHMPMETAGDVDLGPRPILTGMSDVQVRETALWHLTRFQGYIGVNSHRGRTATEDRRVMKAVMAQMAPHGMMFLDSRNSQRSVAEGVAREAGMLAAGNDFFIDDKPHTSAIYRQLDAAAAHARRHGAAIAIGNPHAVTVQAVKAWMKKHDGEKVLVAPLTHVAQVANGVKPQNIVIAGGPPPQPSPKIHLADVASELSEDAGEKIQQSLTDVAADIFQSLFNGGGVD